MQKRHYSRGYHIEFFSAKTKQSGPEKIDKSPVYQLSEAPENDCILGLQASTLEAGNEVVKEAIPLQVEREPIQKHTAEKKVTPDRNVVIDSDDLQRPGKPAAQVHPAAAGSLLFGILSALCFVGMFASSFNPLALVIALTIGLFVFAILAKRLSKRAFEDMYHARNRYSGRAFAAAGLALSVITIVTFLGLLAVMLFGIAFISLS